MTSSAQRHPATAVLPVLALLLALVIGLAGTITARAQEATPGATPEASPAATAFLEFEPLPAGEARAEGPLAVAATTGLVADFVRQVGGQRVDVASVLPANADPHDYEPSPQDVVAIEEAEVVFTYGLNLDEWASDLVANSGTEAPVFTVAEGVETLQSDEEEFAEGDPHAWFDPRNVKVMVDNIAAALTEVDPAGAATYEARARAYQAQLDALDAAIAERIATIPAENRKLVTNHDAFQYYAARYGLDVVGTVIPSIDTRAEPSAEDVAALVDVIEQEGVPAIFAENTTSPALAEELAAQTGVEIVAGLYTDSLGEPGSGADTYLGLMQTDTALIVDALA
jgi:ABC-type Zn uptake system ZnuABC Zn-binding protein ZnuA